MPSVSDKKFKKLIECVYEAALDANQLQFAMEQIARAFHATTSLLQVQNVQAGTTTVLPSPGFSADHLLQYGMHYWKVDLWAEGVKMLPLNSAHICSDVVQERAFANSEIWNDFGRNIGPGTFRALGATIPLNASLVALIGFHRPRDARDFVRSDSESLNRLLPHLRRALQIRATLNASLKCEALAYDALETLSVPLAVVRADATVIYANAAARMLAAQHDGFDLGNSLSGIAAATQRETQTLHRLIAEAALTTVARAQSAGGAINLSRPSQRNAYQVVVSPLARRFGDGDAAALVVIVDPDDSPVVPSAVLVQLFGLTMAEARLALALASGETLAQAAEQFGVTPHTVRMQIRSIFSKTQTSRQAELMRLLSALSIVR